MTQSYQDWVHKVYDAAYGQVPGEVILTPDSQSCHILRPATVRWGPCTLHGPLRNLPHINPSRTAHVPILTFFIKPLLLCPLDAMTGSGRSRSWTSPSCRPWAPCRFGSCSSRPPSRPTHRSSPSSTSGIHIIAWPLFQYQPGWPSTYSNAVSLNMKCVAGTRATSASRA